MGKDPYIERAKDLLNEKMVAMNGPGITAIVEFFGFADDDPSVLIVAQALRDKDARSGASRG